MTDSEKISRIIEIELQITQRIIFDRTFRPCIGDEYQEKRDELLKLRTELNLINKTTTEVVSEKKKQPKKRKTNQDCTSTTYCPG